MNLSALERVLLIGTYDLGHQPFGLASPAAWLYETGFQVDCLDLSRSELDTAQVAGATVIAFYVPMHTATRLALDVLPVVRDINPTARVCFYGLYGQANVAHLAAMGVDAVISGEFEAELVRFVDDADSGSLAGSGNFLGPDAVAAEITPLDRLMFRVPDRSGLPPLADYPRLAIGADRRVVGYTEATRGCRHMCRHCPIPPVYGGRLRVVQLDVVFRDIAAQVAGGAEHVTFGDPDFFNAPAHALRVVETLHARHPAVTYDVTIKIEHLLRHRPLLPTLARTGCLFITSAVESIDDTVLGYLDKGHTRRDFITAVALCARAGVVLNPTFVAFHPWLTRATLRETFELLDDLNIVGSVAPIQMTTRLLVPEGSLLLDLPGLRGTFGPFDREKLVYPWRHRDPRIDDLQVAFERLVARNGRRGVSRHETFDRLWLLAGGEPPPRVDQQQDDVPQFLEPWFCCSEPVGELLTGWREPGRDTDPVIERPPDTYAVPLPTPTFRRIR
jgi:radical SAM superfamily enzyme YgiQ (UPF0313 family)